VAEGVADVDRGEADGDGAEVECGVAGEANAPATDHGVIFGVVCICVMPLYLCGVYAGVCCTMAE